MFHTNMIESTMNTVEIPDFDEDTVEGMLEFMYTGEVEGLVSSERATELLQIAEKYDLPGLKSDCEHTLVESLAVENAANILLMAHLYNAIALKRKVMTFITK